MKNRCENIGNSDRLYFLGSKITGDCDCNHEIKRSLLLGIKPMTNLDSILKKKKKKKDYFTDKHTSSVSYVVFVVVVVVVVVVFQ